MEAKESMSHDKHEGEEARYCREFQKQDASTEEKAQAAHHKAVLERAEAAQDHLIPEREISAQKQILEVITPGTAHLRKLLAHTRAQAKATQSLFQRLRREVRTSAERDEQAEGSAGQVQSEDVLEELGRAEGIATSACAEMQDLVQAAFARHSEAEKVRSNSLSQLQANVTRMAKVGLLAAPAVVED